LRGDYPIRFVEFSNDGDFAVLRRFSKNQTHGFVSAFLHRIPSGLGVPAGDCEQDMGIANLSVQAGTSSARRSLENLAHAQPRRGVLLCRMTWLDVNLENVLHVRVQQLSFVCKYGGVSALATEHEVERISPFYDIFWASHAEDIV
jgi:hypothetical protein